MRESDSELIYAYMDLTRILKIAVQDSSFMKNCSPIHIFAVPVYKHEYLSLIFFDQISGFLYSALLWYCTSYFTVEVTSKILNSYYSNNIYGPKWSWAEMVKGRNGNGPK